MPDLIDEIPSGFGMFIAQIILSGRTKPYSVTCGYKQPTTPTTPTTSANTIFTHLTEVADSAAGPFEGGQMQTNWQFNKVIAYENQGGVVLRGDSTNTPVNGTVTAASNGMIVSSSTRVSKRTSVVGRQYRGRMYVPYFLTEDGVSQTGMIGTTPLAALQQAWSAFSSRMVTSNRQLYLLHLPPISGTTPAPTAITALLVQSQVGTQRRRLR